MPTELSVAEEFSSNVNDRATARVWLFDLSTVATDCPDFSDVESDIDKILALVAAEREDAVRQYAKSHATYSNLIRSGR